MSFGIVVDEPVLVCEGDLSKVGWGPFQFPRVYRISDGRIVATFDVCKDLMEDEGLPQGLKISSDKGQSWEDVNENEYEHIFSQTGLRLNDGSYIKTIVSRPVKTEKDYYKKLPRAYFTYIGNLTHGLITPAENIPDSLVSKNWEFQTYDPETGVKERFECKLDYPGQCMYLGKSTDNEDFIVSGFPRSFDPVCAPDGTLWISHYDYGRNPETGEITLPYYFCSYFRSTDNGKSFKLKSFIPYNPQKLSFPEAFLVEGFCEPCLHFAPDGSMITLLRTGSRNFSVSSPTYIARSKDGISWSEPKVFDNIGVWPQLLSLKCGVTLASYGRPGVVLRATDDKACETWQDPIEILKDTGENLKDNLPDTCGYTALLEIDDDTALLIYTDFTRKDKDGNNHKCIMSRTIHIKKA